MCQVDDDMDAFYSLLKDESKYPFRPAVEANDSVMSRDNYILQGLPKLKAILCGHFNRFKDSILRYESTSVQVTTSWLTKTSRGEHSAFHTHKNSFFSGVLYFDTIEGGANIEFTNFNVSPRTIDVNPPAERNPYNSNVISIAVGANMLLFFPSYLFHRIGTHQADEPRYSLAFNLLPDGLMSTTADSEYHYRHGS